MIDSGENRLSPYEWDEDTDLDEDFDEWAEPSDEECNNCTELLEEECNFEDEYDLPIDSSDKNSDASRCETCLYQDECYCEIINCSQYFPSDEDSEEMVFEEYIERRRLEFREEWASYTDEDTWG